MKKLTVNRTVREDYAEKRFITEPVKAYVLTEDTLGKVMIEVNRHKGWFRVSNYDTGLKIFESNELQPSDEVKDMLLKTLTYIEFKYEYTAPHYYDTNDPDFNPKVWMRTIVEKAVNRNGKANE